MGSSRVLAGNLAVLAITVSAFLQLLPWPLAGYLIIGAALLASFSYLDSPRGLADDASSPTSATQVKVVKERLLRKQPEPGKQPGRETERRASGLSRASVRTAALDNSAPQEKTREAPERIAEGDYLSLSFELEKGEEVTGEVSSTENVNVYVLTEENLDALDQDQEFWYEAGREGVRNTTLRFKAPEDGTWFLVVENPGDKEAFAKVKTNVNKASHLPLLKTESLRLTDAKLEGKL